MELETLTRSLALGVSTLAEALSGLIVTVAIFQVIWLIASFAFRGKEMIPSIESARLTLGRWLSLALELLLAADILQTAGSPTWDDIGKLAAIVILRTLLNFFLQREIDAADKRVSGGLVTESGNRRDAP